MKLGRKPTFTAKQVERMKYLKNDEGLPVYEIAKIMGVASTTIARYLNDETKPREIKPCSQS